MQPHQSSVITRPAAARDALVTPAPQSHLVHVKSTGVDDLIQVHFAVLGLYDGGTGVELAQHSTQTLTLLVGGLGVLSIRVGGLWSECGS